MRHIVESPSLLGASAIGLEIPKGQFAFAGQAGADFHHGGGTHPPEEELLRAIEHHLYGSADDLRQPCGFRRRRTITFSAESAADERRDDAHILLRHTQSLSHLLLHADRHLCAGPHGRFGPFDAGQRRPGL